MGPVLTVRDLSCRRGDRVLFKGFHLQVHPGQVVWVRGANGRGKTSLLRLLAGLSRPDAGAIVWDAGSRTDRRPVYIGHHNALKDDLTAIEALQFLACLHGRPAAPDRLEAALRQCGVHARRNAPVRNLSQGQRRRVALARLCLEHHPSMWILDEPFDALDTQGVETLNRLLADHAGRGGCAVLTSHLALTLQHPSPLSVSLDNVPA